MMTENIELRSYSVRNEPDGDIAEYHEINQEAKHVDLLETETSASKFPSDPINDYDFFTQMDRKMEVKKSKRKKKSKKPDTPLNLMDIISSELASLTVPITENRINFVEDRNGIQNSYLQTSFSDYRLQHRPHFIDSEHGQLQSSRAQTLSPIFPNLLESFTEDLLPTIPVEYIGPTAFCDLLNENQSGNRKESIKFLDVALKDITFKHHHSYSLESLLCIKLIENYKQYKSVQDALKDLSHDIKVNRETKDNLKKDLLKVSPNKKEDIRLDATVRKYTGQLLQLKEKYKTCLKLEKEVSHKIISIWSDIEMIRDKFQRKDAPYSLNITKHTLNKSEFEKEWNNLYEEEFTDMLTKVEYDYGTKCIEYKEYKHDGKNDNNSRKRINKPKMHVDEDKIKKEIEGVVNSILSRDKIGFVLEKDDENISELKAIRNVYQFEIYVDKAFVCESEPYTSEDKWLNVTFMESFSIELLSDNQLILILLLENEEKVAELKVNISEIQRNKTNDDFTKVEFIYDKDVLPTTDFVGSGHSIKEIVTANKVRLKSSNSFKGNLNTACEVNVKFRLNENINQTQSDAIRNSVMIGAKLKRLLHGAEKPNLEVMTEIIGKIYGKDVSEDDAIINALIHLFKIEDVKRSDEFAIDENSTEFIRLKLLHLRNSGGLADVRNKMIPIHGSQISTEQLNCLQKTKEKYFDLDYLKDKEVDMDPIELQRFIAAKYMQKLNTKMLKNLNEHLMVKTRKDVVREFSNFSLWGLFSREDNSSTLASNGTKQQILTESLSKEQEIQITVQRAFNLLNRSTALIEDGDDNEETIAEPGSGYRVRPLRPFVRVSYRGVSAQTVTAIGCHPSWNHTLKLCSKLEPLSTLHVDIFDECKVNISGSSNDQTTLGRTVHYRYFNRWLGTARVPLFTVLSLGSLRGTFKVSSPPILFGYEAEHNKESQSLIPEITQLMKKDTSYITLHITTALAHLGGFREFNQPLPSDAEDDYIIKHLNSFVTDFTNDFPNRNISLTFIDSGGRNRCVTQFLQPIPPPDRDFFPKNPKSCGSAMSKSSGVSRSSSSRSSGRRREVDVEASEEKESVYSQEGNFKGGDSLVKALNACLRFVALIPSYEVTDNHVVTLMGTELLKVLHGSPLDHTLLLASYFLYLGIKSWIAIGLGLPRGRSSYVLIQYDLTTRRFVLTSDQLFKSRGLLNRNDGYLWYVCDALSGDRHELRDVGCPLKTVDYVFDNENIWVNVQSSQSCENVSFDLSKSSDWTPVFDKSTFVMKQPIVNDSQLYSSPGNVESLRRGLEAKIKGKVQKWRPHMKTIWNRYCSGLLREALLFLEYWAFNPGENKPGFSQKIKQLMVTYRMYGFPLNLPFLNTKTVMSSVKASGLHINDDPSVEFALGVEVYPYPNNVLSVWVFLATITRV